MRELKIRLDIYVPVEEDISELESSDQSYEIIAELLAGTNIEYQIYDVEVQEN